VAQLDRLERRLVTQRAAEGVPAGGFDLAQLRAIHRHLFRDVYDWAGEPRTVEIAKGGHQFQFRRFIETGMRDVDLRLVRAAFLQRLSRADVATATGRIMDDVNKMAPGGE